MTILCALICSSGEAQFFIEHNIQIPSMQPRNYIDLSFGGQSMLSRALLLSMKLSRIADYYFTHCRKTQIFMKTRNIVRHKKR